MEGNSQSLVIYDEAEELIECKICSEKYLFYQIFYTEECSHMFCQNCIKLYCSNKINDGDTNIRCPEDECQKELNYYEIKFIINDNILGLERKYEKFLLEKTLRNYDDISWCPVPNCETPCPKDNNRFTKCIKCNFIFCSSCYLEAHFEVSCEEAKLLKNVTNFDEWLQLKGDKIKNCPNCKFLCEKISGCDRISCGKCKSFFCWLCLAILDNKTIDHFDKFHSTKSNVAQNPTEDISDSNSDSSDSD